MSVCGFYADWSGEITNAVRTAREAWCQGRSDDVLVGCNRHFELLDQTFRTDWRRFRSAQVSALSPPKLASGNGRQFDLRNADLVGARLIGVDFAYSRLAGANLEGAQLQGASLIRVPMEGALLRGAQLQGADLRWAVAPRVVFDEAQMQDIVFGEAKLLAASLQRAQLQGAVFVRTEMQRANLRGADLQGANLFGAQLQAAGLDAAGMQGAFLRGADLQGSSLAGALMQDSNLGGAQLQGADLGNARISNRTNLIGTSFYGAALRFSGETTLQNLNWTWQNVIAFLPALPADAPPHWQEASDRDLDVNTFHELWRAWASTLDPPVTIAPDWPP